ncbi:MAG: hypothetical protein MUF49_32320 [Oculatellaceae cyanobacterium Prado106]|jgi:hypothetical protein|nr:hypothetical protein [Oculatellaceae cyanobacterium Prado106]
MLTNQALMHFRFELAQQKQSAIAHSQSNQPEEIFRPLFLTYSDRLADRARTAVKSILASHVQYLDHPQTLLDGDRLKDFNQCFQPFQAFLRAQLSDEAVEAFPLDQYISFHRFKQLYGKAFPKAKESAEICWHAIRTYIKGFGFAEDRHEFLSVTEYHNEIAASHKSIADDLFKFIHNKIWKWYRELQEKQGYWDDQDLVRAALKSMNTQPNRTRYAAIFCDEAQDFTCLELQVILQLSIWSQYRLHPPVGSLPFAFAGDPMQTSIPPDLTGKVCAPVSTIAFSSPSIPKPRSVYVVLTCYRSKNCSKITVHPVPWCNLAMSFTSGASCSLASNP